MFVVWVCSCVPGIGLCLDKESGGFILCLDKPEMFTQRQRHNSCVILLLNHKLFSSQKWTVRSPEPHSFRRGSLAGALSPRSFSFVYISVMSSFCHFVVLTCPLTLALAGPVLIVGWVLLDQSVVRTVPHSSAHRPTWSRQSVQASPCQVTLDCINWKLRPTMTVVQAGVKVTVILPPQFLKFWDYRQAPPLLAVKLSFSCSWVLNKNESLNCLHWISSSLVVHSVWLARYFCGFLH